MFLVRFELAMRESRSILEAVLVGRGSEVRGKESENEVWLSCRERCAKERREKKKKKSVEDMMMLVCVLCESMASQVVG